MGFVGSVRPLYFILCTFRCGGACVGTGGRLLSVTSQVRFLPPQPVRKGKPIGDGNRLERGRAMSLEGSTPSPSACAAQPRVGELQSTRVAKSESRTRDDENAAPDSVALRLRDPATSRPPLCPWPIGRGTSFPSWTGGFDSRRALCTQPSFFRGSRWWYVTPVFGTGGRRFDSYPRSFGRELVAAGACHER